MGNIPPGRVYFSYTLSAPWSIYYSVVGTKTGPPSTLLNEINPPFPHCVYSLYIYPLGRVYSFQASPILQSAARRSLYLGRFVVGNIPPGRVYFSYTLSAPWSIYYSVVGTKTGPPSTLLNGMNPPFPHCVYSLYIPSRLNL